MTQDIKNRLEREPFRPFIIELASGAQIAIGKDSELFFPRRRPELIIAFTDDGFEHHFEISVINRLIE